MEAPKCKICGQRHYGVCAAAAPPEPQPLPPNPPPEPGKAGFDRVAYQREYMRKRRAAQRAAKEGN